MKNLIYYVIFISLLGCCYKDTVKQELDFNKSIEQLEIKSVEAFNKAEKEVFQVKPTPTPDDGTNPDPAKCVCRGTGIIVQGDGHKTQCPYHSK